MIRTVAIVADTHADQHSRWDEHCRVMSWIVEDIARRRCDLVVHTGDIYDGISTPAERAFVSGWCQAVCEASPLAVCGGNHEEPGDVGALGKLRTRHPIVATERPMVATMAGIAVAFLPWPRKAHLLAAIGQPVDAPTADRLAVECLQSVLRGLGAGLHKHDGPRVLTAHVMIGGSLTDHDQPIIGTSMELSVGDLALAAPDFAALGHIHTAVKNTWRTPIHAAYPGAPYHVNYGEPGPGKGYLIARLDGHQLVSLERVRTPCTPMLLLAARYSDGGLTYPGARPDSAMVAGADVRLRYRVKAAERAAASLVAAEEKARLLAAGAVVVKVEADPEVVAVMRAPTVAAAGSTEEQLLARWDTRGQYDDDERARLLAKFADVEEAAAQ